MEFLGKWKLKKMLSADENGVKLLEGEELLKLAAEDGDIEKLLRSDFYITEEAIEIYFRPNEEEIPMAIEEGLEITELGVLIESHSAKIEDGALMIDYDGSGDYLPVSIDEEECISISDGMMIIERA
ncbi:MAG: hypothetical protein IKC32_04850 [Clostridia bacterium]|nr:hypothetical protein [Clostridia bacterium]